MVAAATGGASSTGTLLCGVGPGEAVLAPSTSSWWRASSLSCWEMRPNISDLKENSHYGQEVFPAHPKAWGSSTGGQGGRRIVGWLPPVHSLPGIPDCLPTCYGHPATDSRPSGSMSKNEGAEVG